jgi:hypothetical protein
MIDSPVTNSKRITSSLMAVWVRLLLASDQVTELRALKYSEPRSSYKYTCAGWYDADHVDEMVKEGLELTKTAKGVYFTLNPLNYQLHARRYNSTDKADDGELSKDKDVIRRQWFLIDLDPVRDSLISATDVEKAEALRIANAIKLFLTEEAGWPYPIMMDSGNGYYLLYRIDLPADDGEVCKRCLETLATRFDTKGTVIDCGVFNPGRIIKVPGTYARKGDGNAPERPHRQSRIIEIPGCDDPADIRGACVQIVPVELMEGLAEEYVEAEQGSPGPDGFAGKTTAYAASTNGSDNWPKLRVPDWLRDYGVGFKDGNPTADARQVWKLDRCPFDASHADGDAVIMQAADGRLSARCCHNSCKGRGWRAFRDAIGRPDHNRHYDRTSNVPASNDRSQPSQTSDYVFHSYTCEQLAAMAGKPEWLIRLLLVRGQPIIMGGPRKSLKTSILIALAIALSAGVPFLGFFHVYRRVRTQLISGESDKSVIYETAQRICRAQGVDYLQSGVRWDFRLPRLSVAGELSEMGAGLKREGIEVVLLDPAYLCLLAGQRDIEAANVLQMGPLLDAVSRTCLDAGATPAIAHHTKKGIGYEPLELEDLSYTGFAEYAAQWLLVNRREAFEPPAPHRLWLNAGGRCGQGGLFAVEVDEGTLNDDFTGRRWDVTVKPGKEARDDQKEERQAKRQAERRDKIRADKTTLLTKLDGMTGTTPDGWVSKNKLRDGLGWSGARFTAALSPLLTEMVLETDKVPMPDAKGAWCSSTRNQTIIGVRRVVGRVRTSEHVVRPSEH